MSLTFATVSVSICRFYTNRLRLLAGYGPKRPALPVAGHPRAHPDEPCTDVAEAEPGIPHLPRGPQ